MKKRILCLLLSLVLCLSLLPTAVFADWIEDAEQCELCNGWDEGDNICDNCGCHENGICADWTHCLECGACFADIFGFCTECGICADCYNTSTEHCILCGEHVGDTCEDCGFCESCIEAWETHCPECGACLADEETYLCIWHKDHCLNEALICDECGICYFEDPDSYCEDCYLCIECAIAAGKHCGICEECADGEICDQCGMCPDCALENEMHCPECGDCVNGEMCLEGGEHCQNCCVLCESCERCVEANGLDICSDCGLCEECCSQLSMDEGCESGEVCVASAEWDEHFCKECGLCFCAADPCDDCGLCIECCAAASMDAGCSTGDVCAESSEWDHHFCDDCGVCFCEVDWCDYCGLCIDCCEANSECGDGMCVEDPDYGDHFCFVCGQCFHDVDQCAACAGNGDIVCLDCCEHEEHSAPVVNENAPEILRQPKDYVGPASYSSVDIYTTFSVKLKNPDGATYQWQRQINSGEWETLSEMWLFVGVDTDTLKTYVSEDSCDPDMHYRFRCKVTNAYGTTYSDVVELKSVHNYSDGCVEYDSEQHGNMCSCGLFIDLEPHKFTAWKVTKEATATETGLRERSCTGCGYKETEVIPKIHVHTFSTTYSKDVHYHWYACTTSGCDEVSGKALHEFGDLVVTTPATEAAYGSGYRACKICGMKVYEDIPKLPHTHDFIEGPDFDDPEFVIFGTPEYKEYNTYNDAYHWKICLKKIGTKTCGYVYEKQVHNYGQWTVPSSVDGYMTRTCLTCFYKQERYATEEERSMYQLQTSNAKILINGKANQGDFANAGDTITLIADYSTDTNHIFGSWSVGHYWDDEGHDHPSLDLTDAEKKNPTLTFTMPAHMVNVKATVKVCHHDDVTKQHLDESTAVPASCFTAGKKADLICDICHGVVEEGEMISAYGEHDYQLDESTVIEATCTKVGFTGNMVCTRCGDTIRGERVAKLEHTYGETEVITAPTCHSLGLEGKTCSECGYILRGDRIERTAHTESDWIADALGHMTKCTDPDCGALIEKKTAHTDGDEDGKCDICGYNLAAADCEHTDTEIRGAKDPTCIEEGYTGDVWCKVCETLIESGTKIDKIAHTPGTEWKSDADNHWHECTTAGCGIIIDDTKAAHVDANGDYKCDTCGYALPAPTAFTVTFDANGGSVTPESSKTGTDGKLSALPSPVRAGYDFTGWYTAASGGTKVTSSNVFTADTLLYAHWERSSYGGGSSSGGSGGGIAVSGSVRSSSVPSWVEKTGTWTQDAEGVWSYTNNGVMYRNCWACVYNPYANPQAGQRMYDWFWFDGNAKMYAGWLDWTDGNRYYLNPVHDGTYGAMLTGWKEIDGKWYYFNGTEGSGSMGAMLHDTTTPDGYRIGADGVWMP